MYREGLIDLVLLQHVLKLGIRCTQEARGEVRLRPWAPWREATRPLHVGGGRPAEQHSSVPQVRTPRAGPRGDRPVSWPWPPARLGLPGRDRGAQSSGPHGAPWAPGETQQGQCAPLNSPLDVHDLGGQLSRISRIFSILALDSLSALGRAEEKGLKAAVHAAFGLGCRRRGCQAGA